MRNNSEERSSHLLRGGNLISRTLDLYLPVASAMLHYPYMPSWSLHGWLFICSLVFLRFKWLHKSVTYAPKNDENNVWTYCARMSVYRLKVYNGYYNYLDIILHHTACILQLTSWWWNFLGRNM